MNLYTHASWLQELLVGFEWSDVRPKIVLSSLLIFASKVVSVSWVIYKSARQKKTLPFDDIPFTVPNAHWILGHLGAMGSGRVVEGQKELCFTYASPRSGISTFWQMNIPVVSFLRAQDVSRVAQLSAERVPIPSLAKHFKRLLGRHSLIMSNGKEWKSNRTIVLGAFLKEAMEDAQAIIVKTSFRFETSILSSIRNSDDGFLAMDILDLSKMVTLDTFGLAALGYDFGCTQNDQLKLSSVVDTFEFVTNDFNQRCYSFKGRLNPAAQYYWIPTPSNLKSNREMKKLRQLLLGIVQDRRAAVERNTNGPSAAFLAQQRKAHRGNLLDHLLWGSMNSHGKVDLTDEYLSDFLVTMLFGGFETSSLAVCNTLYLLALHPAVEQACVDEIARVLGPYPSMPPDSFNVLNDLPYCCAVVYEALRLLPPVIAIVRNLCRPMKVHVNGPQEKEEEVEIPAKTRVFLSIWWIHRYKENFDKPEEFIPERWVRQTSNGGKWTERHHNEESLFCGVRAANRKHMFAFSAGARSCVGERFAMRQIPTALAFFLRSFKAELGDNNYSLKLMRSGPNQVPIGGIPMTIRSRT